MQKYILTTMLLGQMSVCLANPDSTSRPIGEPTSMAPANEDIAQNATTDEVATLMAGERNSLRWQDEAVTTQVKPEKMYHFNWKIDAPVTAVGVVWTTWAFSKIYDKPNLTLDEVAAIDKNKVNKIDRWAAGYYSDEASAASDILFYGAMPLPIVLLLDKKIRHDAPKVGFLYLEAMAVTGLLYTGSTYFIDRYRPETYRVEKPENLTSGNYKNSFFAGHVALVGTSTFFMAKIYNDYHPRTAMSYVLWGGAIAATGATGYLRHRAGKHFPTDIAVGTAVGILSGVGIPALHKNKVFRKRGLSLAPSFMGDGMYGFCLNYRM